TATATQKVQQTITVTQQEVQTATATQKVQQTTTVTQQEVQTATATQKVQQTTTVTQQEVQTATTTQKAQSTAVVTQAPPTSTLVPVSVAPTSTQSTPPAFTGAGEKMKVPDWKGIMVLNAIAIWAIVP